MKKEKVRERIIRVASELFYKQGFNSTGINQIIAEADIAIGSLYNHFSSKNDLLQAYLLKEEENWFEGFESSVINISEPKEKILALVDYRKKLQQSSKFAGCHFIKIISEIGDSNPVVFDFVKKHKEKQKDLIKLLIINCGETSSASEPDITTDNIFLLIEGAVVTSTINKNSDSFGQVKKIVEGLLP
ncbi:TetR/AcrR family transcriptional regulator [Chryseobacterium lactis]|uniref:TetR/AcrR family transcriptional regulator n=1 Tax=Chryseobacterium lactis TaxID=1241981 RepID=A0A3G6RKS1_CHRLC|nr:TetR/AcrR family transcriptional regulator [Chryseobacterium lactis]AZA80473.1 TetR/AcrR family transcriptional regulator [Chryseobacterium lactis]AZB05475.1 TetR/AcrR family transcriptional regulator [Chryseobacterium lactis]PNW11390.1 TetR/AcrR family transcriptional regulator [Chryseobacterium lactis]